MTTIIRHRFYFHFFGFILLFNSITLDKTEENNINVDEFSLDCIVTWVCDKLWSGTSSYVTLSFQFRDGSTCQTKVNI